MKKSEKTPAAYTQFPVLYETPKDQMFIAAVQIATAAIEAGVCQDQVGNRAAPVYIGEWSMSVVLAIESKLRHM